MKFIHREMDLHGKWPFAGGTNPGIPLVTYRERSLGDKIKSQNACSRGS